MEINSALSFFVHKATLKNPDEIKTEKHFQSTHSRNPDGRFMVQLPMCRDPSSLYYIAVITTCQQYLWSDSIIVIAWINSNKQLSPYVANRVARILDSTRANQWRHVPTRENPADLITRGVEAYILHKMDLWWNGPAWLLQQEKMWPVTSDLPAVMPEIKNINTVLIISWVPFNELEAKFLSWSKLTRITAWLKRFCKNACTTLSTLLICFAIQ